MRNRFHPSRRSGFTLTEVLVALGIFALGSVAVASIFPSAILIQKRSIQDVNSEVFEAAIRAQLLGRGFEADDLVPAGGTPSRTVVARPDAVQTLADPRWSLRARSYGSLSEDAVDREMFWKPLFFDANPLGDPAEAEQERSWSVFVFIVRPSSNGTYPKGGFAAGDLAVDNPTDPEEVPAVTRLDADFDVVSGGTAPDRYALDFGTNGNTRNDRRLVRIGDSILLETGKIHAVTDADEDGIEIAGPVQLADGVNGVEIWYADPGEARETSFVKVFELIDADGPTDYLVH